MKKGKINKITSVYALIGFAIIGTLFINQFLEMEVIEKQPFQPSDLADTINIEIDTVEIDWEDISY